MKLYFLPLYLVLWGLSIRFASADVPSNMTIGTISTTNTEFNIGEGDTDETASYNHIQIENTAGTTLGLNSSVSTTPGQSFYRFYILVPNCSAVATDTQVALKTTYGTVVGATTVDIELLVNAWANTQFDEGADQDTMDFCLRADVMIVNAASAEVLYQRKHFIFHVTVITSTFTYNETDLGAFVDTPVTEGSETSGTTVTAEWQAANPLAPGEAAWFKLTPTLSDYIFTGFDEVDMSIGGGGATPLIDAGTNQDSVLTSSEVLGSGSELHLYHILPQSVFTTEAQLIEFTGKAAVAYNPARRGLRALQATPPPSSPFSITARLAPSTASPNGEGGSGGYTLEVLKVVVSGAGLAAAALI